jgi:hypothetical protein
VSGDQASPLVGTHANSSTVTETLAAHDTADTGVDTGADTGADGGADMGADGMVDMPVSARSHHIVPEYTRLD